MQEARLFSFGVGSAVNRYLLDEMALAGRGAAQFVRPDEDTAAVVDRFAHRIDKAALTDITIDWNGLAVDELAPAAVPDLFVGQPLVVAGRYRAPGHAAVTVRGRQGGRPVAFTIPVELPAEMDRPAVATVWARRTIAELDRRLLRGADAAAVAEVTRLGLEHRLVTAYTSFVAVDESHQVAGEAVRVVVPVEVPEGVAHAVGHGGSGWGYGAVGYGAGGGGVGYGFGSMRGGGEAGVLGVISAGGRAASAPTVLIGTAVATGDLDKNLIRRYVRRKLPAIRHCYEKALVHDHDLAGTVTSTFTIGADGKVTESTAHGIGDPALESCVAEVIGEIEFPAARGEGLVEVRYPFTFKRAE
jgi:Ca-activated chloride channel family protein